MFSPILAMAAEPIGHQSAVTVGLALGILVVGVAWGQNAMQLSGLREWRQKAEQQIAGLQSELSLVKATASTQGQQIAHVIEMLTELRADVKRLLQRRDTA